ncbi:DMT family transporter [Microlunatus flavus]|uniref:Permease of the drug/metabolite transporter (DMT) superfamily n=1 Tax=Microlunatus flavus TaxID=1036181 RepID=A0A1H9GYI1_9ACTN|nr:DMT family transporter [Microlunatus flavus]SEQ55176.1 Permease of the drug/metabolite transporter (DMT) superfamily [Microlunatus flavus]
MQITRSRPGLATDLVLMGVALVWGSSYLVAKDLTLAAPVLVVLALRYAISAVALGVVCRRAHVRVTSVRELAVGVLLGCTQAAVLTLETFGVSRTTATNAGLIISLTVVLTPLLDGLWRRRPMPAPFFAATAVAVVGVALLVSGDGFRAPGWGDGLMLAAAAVRAVHVSLIGRLTTGRAYGSLTLTTTQAVVGAVLLSAAAAPELGRTVTHLPPAAWAQLGYLALACTVFAFLAQTWAIRRTSPSRASLLMGTEPVWAVAVGVTLGGESLSVVTAGGAVLIVAATYYGQHVERNHRLGALALAPAPEPAERLTSA